MYPYEAPDTTKFHTPITLGMRLCAKPLVFEPQRRRPCGFDSHRPLHCPAGIRTRRDTRQTPLHGKTAKERALTTMWERRVEQEGFASVMEAIRNTAAGLKGYTRLHVPPWGLRRLSHLNQRAFVG
jgi:hypothetical protein